VAVLGRVRNQIAERLRQPRAIGADDRGAGGPVDDRASRRRRPRDVAERYVFDLRSRTPPAPRRSQVGQPEPHTRELGAGRQAALARHQQRRERTAQLVLRTRDQHQPSLQCDNAQPGDRQRHTQQERGHASPTSR
jgi:hypothetical protein